MSQHWRRTSMMPDRLPERLFSNFLGASLLIPFPLIEKCHLSSIQYSGLSTVKGCPRLPLGPSPGSRRGGGGVGKLTLCLT